MRKSRKRIARNKFYLLLSLVLLVGALIYRDWRKKNIDEQVISQSFQDLPDGFKSCGMDVSHHQGTIDWNTFNEMNDSTVRFVYCKATEGISHVDSQWKRNRKHLIESKMLNGAYHFFLPKKDALRQANHFLANYELKKDDLPPVLDVEVEARSDSELISAMVIWLDAVEKSIGRRPIIYTSHHFYTSKFKSIFKDYKFWIAKYSEFHKDLKDEAIIHWQYSDKGSIPGIVCPVDLNFSKLPL